MSKLVQPVAASAEGQLGTGGVEVMWSLLPQLGRKKNNPKKSSGFVGFKTFT